MNHNFEMKSINPRTFNTKYGNIRAFCDEDGILFVAADVAKAFGFKSSTAASYYYKNPQKHRLEVWENGKLKTIVTATFITPIDCLQLCNSNNLCDEDREAVKWILIVDIIQTLNEANRSKPHLKKAKVSKTPALPRRRDTEKPEAIIERLTRENRDLEQRLHDVLSCCQLNCKRLHSKYCTRI